MVPQQQVGNVPPGLGSIGGSCGGDAGPETAFTFNTPFDGSYTFSTAGSTYDTVLYLYDGVDCTGVELGCNDDTIGQTSEVQVDLVVGQAVYIVLDSLDPNGGDYMLSITQN
jgi:hypothetical protein